MADNVSFREIPDDIRVPGTYMEIDPSRADQGVATMPYVRLLAGQMLTGGTAAPNELIPVSSPDQVAQLAGRGSQLHRMAIASFDADKTLPMQIIATPDAAAGQAASGTITVDGTATAAGTLYLYVGGQRHMIGVQNGDDAADVAASIAAVLSMNADLEVTATAATAVVTLTAKHKGESGNGIDVRVNYYLGEILPPGITLAISAMSGGTGNPDVAPVLAALKGDFYSIVHPWTDAASMAQFETECAERFTALRQEDAHQFVCLRGTYGELTTYGDAHNSAHTTVLPAEGRMRSPWVIAAAASAAATVRGSSDPARPFRGMVLPNIEPPAEKDRFTWEERNNLLKKGISTLMSTAAGETALEQIATTYKVNSFGMPTRAYFKIQSKWTAAYFRYALRQRMTSMFPDFKLASDGTNFAPGQAMVTPSVLKATIVAFARELEYAGVIEDIEQFKTDLLVVRSIADPNRVNSVAAPNLVNQFDVFAAAIQFIN
ncbi:phage tail sheath subtilisin-like domain-containing protein [Burkholderia cenocepacia]|uniref:phage tail sheath subtilisin-like domain-containing protein n=1 Tax=Burkholderia cenocepacia TaxID=95486 RepID=UPI001B98FE6C|nr:phage tail sheath subtilisin-like domain-containing protein [Burkholderia cenocepacia]MBR8137187.1 phage tail sheath subtilisin-like domain-containing protein [Burkholderia cenocepacia]